mgnify:CR=1 FL=1
MNFQNSAGALRETVRLLERKLGVLDDLQSSCCGVTFAKCHAIVEIGRAGSISLNDLADILGLDKSTMSRTINNLVNNELVMREIDPEDRRYINIKLTEKGNQSFKEIEAGMKEYFIQIYNAIPEAKREQVIESLQILLQALSENECCKQC